MTSTSRRALATRLEPQLGRLACAGEALESVLPPDLEAIDRERYVPAERIGHAGIELYGEAQLRRLRRWGRERQDLFSALRTDPAINTRHHGRPYLHNGQYATPDAEIYAALIADRAPERIVELGAGFSTLIARLAVRRNGLSTEIVAVDPEPRTDVAAHVDELVRRPVESLEPQQLRLGPGSILFIDSSHVVRAGGDVPYLFNRLIPELPPGVLVHVHDVFIPYDYPPSYRARCYGEQYVVHALLADAARYRTVLATHWLARERGPAMRAAFGDIVGAHEQFHGASYWFATVDGGRSAEDRVVRG